MAPDTLAEFVEAAATKFGFLALLSGCGPTAGRLTRATA
jgi:hypothetical protein